MSRLFLLLVALLVAAAVFGQEAGEAQAAIKQEDGSARLDGDPSPLVNVDSQKVHQVLVLSRHDAAAAQKASDQDQAGDEPAGDNDDEMLEDEPPILEAEEQGEEQEDESSDEEQEDESSE